MLTIPATAQRPRASIVVVTYNALDWSRRAFASIVANTGIPYELIVIDNLSSDGTREFLGQELSGATVILNDGNFGFGVGANLGAARARAPVIVFVNSDVIVQQGWLEPLCSRLEQDTTVAAVGPRIMDLHGRIDHAGGLLAHDGWSMHYGAGDELSKPEYSFARRVDYVNGACIAVRTRVFHDTGGFDARFAIAYYEDTDLCLRFSSQGWAVVYEPASTVIHAGGASGTPERSRMFGEINHPRFQQRWRELLARRPDAPLDKRQERIYGARDAVASGTILLIGDGTGLASEVARTVRALDPHLCITLVGESVSGVETVSRLTEPWLEARRFHFDLVCGGDDDDALLEATQPLACRFKLDDFRRNLLRGLEAAGIATDSSPVRGG